ncbi:DedA family protein [Francisella noatunensis]|uniref:DedA family protein n=1 Tax=Francisella noatunensis TaxID=657445 RepID=A0A9Q2KS90_9GAMM|nr:DedA family protein [Francisella noatunensis]MBK2028615.1 DedA family protein [Francisella noatunensis]MBK2034385.1 DedA family protein [Francisella noatunensis]MBK2048285.1 DedA family protein [Francisella noatunensis]MBK2050733.1 DedA family protein [Francisella noatunensis]MBK2051158.1 DedA family protein [Francisella noatunensis]
MTQAEFWSLLIDWGYLAAILAVFIEGEIFLIMVGIATAAAMFNYPLVILAATIGAILHDNTIFTISKFMGERILTKKASWHYKAQKSLDILDKHETLAILSIRFLYGFRTVTILIMGISKVKRAKFMILDAISSFIWSTIYLSLGYIFGNALLQIVNKANIKLWIYEHKLLSLFILIFISSIIYYGYRKFRSKRAKRHIK